MGSSDKLTLREILIRGRGSDCSLVCLSACESGTSSYRDVSDEQIDFQTAFLYSGIPSVIGSLWMVDDLSTALLMMRFYDEMFSGQPRARALRRAQVWLREVTVSEVLEMLSSIHVDFNKKNTIALRIEAMEETAQTKGLTYQPFKHIIHWAGFNYFGA